MALLVHPADNAKTDNFFCDYYELCVFTQPIRLRQNVTKGQSSSRERLI